MSFIEARLLDGLAYGFSGGPTWSTTRVGLRNGIERRNVKRSRPLHVFKGSFDRREPGVLAELLNVFNATAGAAYGFRFKNWLDYEATSQPLGLASGSSQTVQLEKQYSFGGQDRSVPIRKPNNDVIIYASGVPISATVNTTTGMATFTATLGQAITWTGTFDVPVHFDSDEFSATIETLGATSIDVSVVEDLSA